ncbi:MAG: hypothetical protein ACPLN0_06755 [Candidatus Hydrothermia bacterium]
MDLKEILSGIENSSGPEKANWIKRLGNLNYSSLYEFFDMLKVLVRHLKDEDPVVRETALSVLEQVIFGMSIEKIIGVGTPFDISQELSPEYADFTVQKREDVNDVDSMHHEIHDFADFVGDFHYENETHNDLPESSSKLKKDENYRILMEKREKYIDLWDFEIPEE